MTPGAYGNPIREDYTKQLETEVASLQDRIEVLEEALRQVKGLYARMALLWSVPPDALIELINMALEE